MEAFDTVTAMLKGDIITGLEMKVEHVAYESSRLLYNETRSGYLIDDDIQIPVTIISPEMLFMIVLIYKLSNICNQVYLTPIQPRAAPVCSRHLFQQYIL